MLFISFKKALNGIKSNHVACPIEQPNWLLLGLVAALCSEPPSGLTGELSL